MRSFLSQAHQRDSQGNVIFPVHMTKSKTHRTASKIAVGALAFIVALTSGLLGIMAFRNQQLQHQVQTLQTQSSAKREPNKIIDEILISEQEYATESVPSLQSN